MSFDWTILNGAVKPGMVLTIDAQNPGKLKISEKAYDRCVAGIISAAGGIQPGMIMSQTGTSCAGSGNASISMVVKRRTKLIIKGGNR